jgi:hypothetical protein
MDLAMHAWAVWEKDPSTVAADSVTGMLKARKMFDQALRLDPNLVFAMYGRAETLFEQLQMELDADHDRLVQER